ncbi:MAG: hypothetical protein ACP5OO_11910 [Chloroflexia bacterium]
MSSWDWLKTRPEEQFLERKSCFRYTPGGRGRRSVKEIVHDLAERYRVAQQVY